MTRLITRCAAVAIMAFGVSPAAMASTLATAPVEAPGMRQGLAPLMLPQGAGADPLHLQEARRGRGHDDGAMHARRGKDDPAGHLRHGRGADDAVGHG